MKKNYLTPLYEVCILAMLFSIVFSCSDKDKDEVKPLITCLPTELLAEESKLKLTYNTENLIEFLEFEENDNPQPGRFKSIYTYNNGKISNIDDLTDNVKESYHSFEYTSNTIVDNHFQKTGASVFEQADRTVFHLQNDRIISWASQEYEYPDYDSIRYTYNLENNVVHIDGYNKEKVKEYSYDLEYDDKINPYKISGINGGDRAYYDEQNLSANNCIKSVYTDVLSGDTETEFITYTYDAEGKPLTRKYDWETTAGTFKYECK